MLRAVVKKMRGAFLFGAALFCLLLSHGAASAQQVPPVTYLFVEVKDTSGKAVADATVAFSGVGDALKTNQEGVAEARPRLWQPSRHYELRVTKPGYLPSEHVLFVGAGRDRYATEELSIGPEGRQYVPEGQVAPRAPPVAVTLWRVPTTEAERRAGEERERRRRLILAVKKGDAAGARALLAAGLGADTADARGAPAIAWAAFTGDPEVIGLLLAAGANVRDSKGLGHQALLIYLTSGVYRDAPNPVPGDWVARHEAVVRTLVEAGAGLNVPDPRRGTVLNAAIERTPHSGQPPHSLTAETIRLLVAAGADPNAPDAGGKTPLMAAARKTAAVVDILLKAGASVRARDKRGRTALMYASGYRYDPSSLEAARRLIAAGADVNAADEEGLTPLIQAVRGHHTAEVRMLLEAGAAASVNARDKHGRTALHYVNSELYDDASAQLVRILKGAGADVNAADEEGLTPLMTGAAGFHAEVIQELIEAGASPGARDKRGRTPLMYAAKAGHLGMMKVLLKAGAAAGAKDDLGQTAMTHAALGFDRPEVINFLAGAGLGVNEVNADGRTPLMLAAQNRSAAVLRTLLELGAGELVNAKDREGRTALMYAMPANPYDRVSEIVKALVGAGANVNDADAGGQTPLMLAAKAGSAEAAAALLEAGALVNARDERGRTALMLAARDRAHSPAVGALLRAGADVDAADEEGRTALMEAAAAPDTYRDHNTESLRLLLAAGAKADRADKRGRTALSIAKEAGDWAAAGLLEEAARGR